MTYQQRGVWSLSQGRLFFWETGIKTFSDDTQGLGADTHPTPPIYLHTQIHNCCKTVHKAQFGTAKLLHLSRVMTLLSLTVPRPQLNWSYRDPGLQKTPSLIFPVVVYFFLCWGAVGPVQGQGAGVSKHSPRAHKYEGRENRKVCIPLLAICQTSFLSSMSLSQLHLLRFPLFFQQCNVLFYCSVFLPVFVLLSWPPC